MNIEIPTPEQNDQMGYNPVLDPVIIGVLTPYNRTYRDWVKLIGVKKYPNATFRRISRIEDSRGLRCHGLEYGYCYWEVPDECVFNAKIRVAPFDKTQGSTTLPAM